MPLPSLALSDSPVPGARKKPPLLPFRVYSWIKFDWRFVWCLNHIDLFRVMHATCITGCSPGSRYCCYCVFAYLTLSVYTGHQEQFSRKHTLFLNQVNTHISRKEGIHTNTRQWYIQSDRQSSSTTVYRRTIAATSVRFTTAPVPSSQSSRYFTWIAPVNSRKLGSLKFGQVQTRS